MARAKKDQYRYVPHEERPEFLALVADLADVPAEEFAGRAKQIAGHYHDAVLAGHVEVLDKMESAYSALVYKLNGETMMGCKADDDSAGHVLARAVAATPGQVPSWGQAGEFLLEVEGVRVWVVMTHHMLGNHRACDLHAVDLDKPFISETGYRSAGLTVTSNIGDTVDQAARRMVLDVMHSEGKMKAIEADAWSRTNPKKRPAWLVDALAGVRADGQLAMFGDAPKDPDAKAPMSNADRQKAFRQRQREKQAALKAEGLHALELSGVDLARLFVALDTHVAFDQPLDWDLQAYRELAARLFKGEDNCAAKVQHLGASVGVANYKKQLEKDAQRGWKAYEGERDVSKKLREKLNAAQAEVRCLQQGLQDIAADMGVALPPMPVVKLGNGQPLDADELTREVHFLGREIREASTEVLELRRQNAELEQEKILLEGERNKAHMAIELWERRLRNAGLSTDYRPQEGE